MQWDELGIAFDDDTVRYGPSYWTFDSYTLDGTPWAPAERMPPVLLGGSWGTETSKFDASNFVELTVYFHTADNSVILPTRVGLISANNQNDYQSSTPLHFMLYGLNEDTNEYELLIDVNAANVNKGNTQLTTISSGFTYHYSIITDTWPLSYIETAHSEVWVDLGNTEYSTNGTSFVSLTGMPNSTNFNYLTFVFDACYVNSTNAADIGLLTHNQFDSDSIWRSRAHQNMGSPGFVGVTWKVTSWTTQTGQNVTSKTQDGVSYKKSSLWSYNSYIRLKIVFDRTTKKAYTYIENNLLGYANVSVDMLNCKYIGLMKEVSSGLYPKVKNIRVAGFLTLAEAQTYNG
jgi:hypothetical protein